LKDIKAKRLAKFAEVLFSLNAKYTSKRYPEVEMTRLAGLRCVVGSMCEGELEWWDETYKFDQVLSHASPSSSGP
jgi:hypothetical protein